MSSAAQPITPGKVPQIDFSKYETPQIDFSKYANQVKWDDEQPQVKWDEPSQPPSLLDRIKNGVELAVDTMPGIGLVHRTAGEVQDWANRKLDPANPHMLSPAATFGTGVARDVAGLVKGATSPAGLATTAATVVAPEVMGPALAAHGIYSAVKGWGDLKNPDVLQNELNSAAEVAGGAAVTGSD